MILPVISGESSRNTKSSRFAERKGGTSRPYRALWTLNTPSVLTTVCGISSRWSHVTLVPTGTVRVAGPKLNYRSSPPLLPAFCCAARLPGSSYVPDGDRYHGLTESPEDPAVEALLVNLECSRNIDVSTRVIRTSWQARKPEAGSNGGEDR